MRFWSAIEAEAQTTNRPLEHVARTAVQRTVVAILGNTDFFSRFVFQGGTALVLAYGNPRMSDDLDFVRRPDAPAQPLDAQPIIDDALLQPVFAAIPEFSPWHVRSQKQTSSLQRLRLSGVYPHSQRALHINFELVDIPAHTQEARRLETLLGPVSIPTETLPEIYADKVIALAFRPQFKGRDVWDVGFLQRRNVMLPEDLVARKIHDYHQTPTTFTKGLESRLATLPASADALREEMTRFLPAPEIIRVDGEGGWHRLIRGSEQVLSQTLGLFRTPGQRDLTDER